MLTKMYEKWVKTLFPYNEERIFVWLGPAGLGDKISCLPAFRHLKRMYPNKKVFLYVEPLSADMWKYCRYIDFVIPEGSIEGPDSLFIRKYQDIGIKAWWSFFEHHQRHICKSNIEYICNTTYTDDIPLEYELDIWEDDRNWINREINDLKDKSKGRPIIGISPAYTMYSRMWSLRSWKKLKDLLIDVGYYVVILGGNNDLDILDGKSNEYNVIDKRNKYPVRILPRILDAFENVITLNSGMLHLASINQNVPITYLNVGQFPSELIVPYREGILGKNINIIEHNCPLKNECFQGHISETSIRPMMFDFLNAYKRETGTDFPEGPDNFNLMKKYVCWHYCLKLVDKYSCAELITPEMVIERISNV